MRYDKNPEGVRALDSAHHQEEERSGPIVRYEVLGAPRSESNPSLLVPDLETLIQETCALYDSLGLSVIRSGAVLCVEIPGGVITIGFTRGDL